jgi:hypothetical protein
MRDVAPTELWKYRSTVSINIPRLRRSGTLEFAGGINDSHAFRG